MQHGLKTFKQKAKYKQKEISNHDVQNG